MARKTRDGKSRPSAASQAPPGGPSREGGEPARVPSPSAAARTTTAAAARARRREGAPLTARTAAWAAALVVATALAYGGALDTPFLLDDPISITRNPVIQRPLEVSALLADPRALVTASLRWNYLAGGFEVGGYHVLNVVAHAVAGLLVFALARVTLGLEVFAGRYTRSSEHLAAVVALVFLLHPMQTESVTYVIQRAEIFVSIGLVGSLLALVAMRSGASLAPMALLAGSCVFGLYSKPSFAVVPALLLVYDICFLSRGDVRGIAPRWPAYALATIAAAATFLLSQSSGSLTSEMAGFDVEGISPLGYLSTQFGVIVHYLRVALWPANLCFDCGYRGPWPVLASPLGDSVLLPAAVLAAIAAASLALGRRHRLLPFAVFASAVVLAPTSSVVPLADFYVEHRMYLPIAFLAMALVPAAHDATGWVAARVALRRQALLLARGSLAAVVAAGLLVATQRRNELLADPIALMEDALEQAPQNERVHYNLANAYKRLGRLDDAIPHYEEAIRLLPNVVRSYQNLGSLYLEQDKPEQALEVYRAGAAAKPEVAMAHRNVANACLQLGLAGEALAAAERSLTIEPNSANGRRLAGDAALALGRRDDALAHWRAGLASSPGDPGLRTRIAKAERG